MRGLLAMMLILVGSMGQAQQISAAQGAMLRVLDKTTGQITDLEMAVGQQTRVGLLGIALRACRYPSGRISADGYAEMELTYDGRSEPIFYGWMIASSPALNPLDHPRYDVWVLRCTS